MAMAHWGIAYCHGPNYNFHTSNGYYEMSKQETGFPSQKVGGALVRAFERLLTALANLILSLPCGRN